MVTILNRINDVIEARAAEEDPFRAHLGGSMIGNPCERALYYNFRWAVRPKFDARMLRLFDRGHKEEFRFVAYLRNAGVEVWEFSQQLMYHPESDCYMLNEWRDLTTPPADPEIEMLCLDVTGDEGHMKLAAAKGVVPKQWRISDVRQHFGGSLDGIANAPFDVEDKWGRSIPAGEKFLNEFKTHNTKSFSSLCAAAEKPNASGVKECKPVHWAQMQIYMHKRDLKWALYMAVNKNDDDLYIEVVPYDPEEGPRLIAKAGRAIDAKAAPDRIGNHPSWHGCKFCDHIKVCHYGEAPDRNCRSCRHSSPVDNGEWHCGKWDAIIPSAQILKACNSYQAITD